MKNAGIILAGGSGSRFDSTLSAKKQFIEFDGEPLFYKSLRCFDESKQFDEIIISLPKDDLEYYKKSVINLSLSSKLDFVEGGETRQKSVWNAFKKIKDFFDIVVITKFYNFAKCLRNFYHRRHRIFFYIFCPRC